MYHLTAEHQVLDDGQGARTAPAYGVDVLGRRFELDTLVAADLTRRWQADHASRLPLGDAVAKITRAVGIAPCAPCKRRQAILNVVGDRIAHAVKGG